MDEQKKKQLFSLFIFFFSFPSAIDATIAFVFFFLSLSSISRAPPLFSRKQSSHAQRPPPRERALHRGDDHARARRDPRGALGLEALFGAARRIDGIDIEIKRQRRRPPPLRLRLGLGGPVASFPSAVDLPRRRPRLAQARPESRPPTALALERQAGVRVGVGAGGDARRAALGRRRLLDHRVVEGRGPHPDPRPAAGLPLRADGFGRERRLPRGASELDGRVADDPEGRVAEEGEQELCRRGDADGIRRAESRRSRRLGVKCVFFLIFLCKKNKNNERFFFSLSLILLFFSLFTSLAE